MKINENFVEYKRNFKEENLNKYLQWSDKISDKDLLLHLWAFAMYFKHEITPAHQLAATNRNNKSKNAFC